MDGLFDDLIPQSEVSAGLFDDLVPKPSPYDTRLTPDEETQFQEWKQQNAPNDSGEDYDLRGAFKEHFIRDQASQHWNDKFKKPNHPTFSDESQYGRPPYAAAAKAGHWTGPEHDVYVPPGQQPTEQPSTLSQIASKGNELLDQGEAAVRSLPTIATSPAADRYFGTIESAWDQLKSDFSAQLPPDAKQFAAMSSWDQAKTQINSLLATGATIKDAVAVVLSPFVQGPLGLGTHYAGEVLDRVAPVMGKPEETGGWESALNESLMGLAPARGKTFGRPAPPPPSAAEEAAGAFSSAPAEAFNKPLALPGPGMFDDLVPSGPRPTEPPLAPTPADRFAPPPTTATAEAPAPAPVSQPPEVGAVVPSSDILRNPPAEGNYNNAPEVPAAVASDETAKINRPPPPTTPTLKELLADKRPLAEIKAEHEAKTVEAQGLVLTSGATLRSVSGREMSPAPRLEGGSERKTSNTLGRIDDWLLKEAKIETAATNPHVSPLLEKLNPKRLTPADRSLLNDILFHNPEGATEANVMPPKGTREEPAPVAHPEAMENARQLVEANPSEAQKEAGNYQKAHVDFHGLPFTMETPKGVERRGPINKETGQPQWTNVHPDADYGYIKRTEGADGEQLDLYIGPNPNSKKVFVVDQYNPKSGKFDEHKAIGGTDSQEQAIAIYDKGFSDGSGPSRRGGVTQMPIGQFKRWAKSGDLKKPLVKIMKVRAAAPPRSTSEEASALDNLARVGGVKLTGPDGKRTKEGQDFLGSLGGHRVPGLINNKTGITPDRARSWFREHGWFSDKPDQGADIQNLYDMVEREARGEKVYHPTSKAAQAQLQEHQEAADARGRDEIHAIGKKYGLDLSSADIDLIIARMQEQGVDAESAIHDHIERAAMSHLDSAAEESPNERHDAIPFEGELASADREAGESLERSEGEPAAAPQAGAGREEPEGVPASPQQTQAPSVEPGAEDAQGRALPQTVIPGAERMSAQEVERRTKLAQNERAKAEMKVRQQQSKMRKGGQQSAGGMFDEGRNQTDLLAPKRESPPSGVATEERQAPGPKLDQQAPAPIPPTEKVPAQGEQAGSGETKKFYVTMIREPGTKGQKVAWLRGPFDTKEAAETAIPEARERAQKLDPWADFDAFGVSARTAKEHPPGTLDKLGKEEKPKFQARPARGFFSALEKGVEGIKLEKAPAIQWRNTIKNLPGVKQEERDWSGVDQWLDGQKGVVTKQQVADFIRANNVQVKEVALGGRTRDETAPDEEAQAKYKDEWDRLSQKITAIEEKRKATRGYEARAALDLERHPLERQRDALHDKMVDETVERIGAAKGPTKFASYTLPGGSNYRELLLTLPVKRLDTTGWKVEREPEGTFGQRVIVRDANGLIHADLVVSEGNTAATDENLIRRFADRTAGSAPELFRSGHFEEPNVVVHLRFDDRTGPNGEKVLHIAEVQSDWHQKGRKGGYTSGEDAAKVRKELDDAIIRDKALQRDLDKALKDNDRFAFGTPERNEARARRDALFKERREQGQKVSALQERMRAASVGVPNAPFKTTWHEIALKRMLRYAAENGYDRLSWDTGATQGERYDLSKQVKRIDYFNDEHLLATATDGRLAIDEKVPPEKLADFIGKDAAERLMKQPQAKQRMLVDKRETSGVARTLEGIDLKIEPTGMVGFYDKILPDFMNKYAKKWGAKVETTHLPPVGESIDNGKYDAHLDAILEHGGVPAHSITITPAMRESVMGGQPLFKRGERQAPAKAEGRVRLTAKTTAVPVGEPSAAEKELLDKIAAIAEQIIPTARVRPMRSIEAEGYGNIGGVAYGSSGRTVIAWSLEGTADAVGTLRHEALHYVRQFLTDSEWQTLVRAARQGKWMTKHDVANRWKGLTYEEQMEEAIAEELNGWRRFKDAPIPEAVRSIFQRIAEFLARIAKYLRERFGAHATADDIFSDIMSGKVGREIKESNPDQGEKFQAQRAGRQGNLPLPSVAEQVGKWMGKTEDKLFQLRQNNEDDRTLIRQMAVAEKRLLDPAIQERAYQHGEEGTPLSPEEQQLFDDNVQPLRRQANRAYNEIKDTGYPVDMDGYMHRMVQGKGSMYDKEAQGSLSQNPTYGRIPRSQNKLTKTAPALKERTIFMADGANGTKKIVGGSQYKPGDTFSENGEAFTVRQATTREIEENTDLRYYKNAFINTADSWLRLRRAQRAIRFLEALKQDPTFQENASGPGDIRRIPPEWKTTRLPQLAGWKLNPRLANLFDDFYGREETALDQTLGRVNRAIVSAIFVEPVSSFFGHGGNVAAHWFVSRGWDNFLPHTYAQSAANGVKAIRDVVTLSPNYRRLMREGASLQLAPVLNRKFHEMMIKGMQGDMNARPQNWKEIAQAAGTTVKAIYDGLSDISSRGLWGLNDVLLLQRIYDLQSRSNMSPKQAIHEAERDIPNYRIPTEAWEGPGGRAFSEAMQNGNITLFGRYRYGVLKAYAESVKGLFKGPAKNRVQDLGKLVATVALIALIYPQVQKAVQAVTGNKDASVRRAGPATLPDALISAATGTPSSTGTQKSFTDALGGLLSLAPANTAALELMSNRDFFTGEHLYEPSGSAWDIAKELGFYGASQFTPADQILRLARGRSSLGETAASKLGIKLPRPGEIERVQRAKALEDRRDMIRFMRRDEEFRRSLAH